MVICIYCGSKGLMNQCYRCQDASGIVDVDSPEGRKADSELNRHPVLNLGEAKLRKAALRKRTGRDNT